MKCPKFACSALIVQPAAQPSACLPINPFPRVPSNSLIQFPISRFLLLILLTLPGRALAPQEASMVPREIKGGVGAVRSVVFSRDGTRVATSSYDPLTGRNELKLWDLKAGDKPRRILYDLQVSFNSLQFSPEAARLYAAGSDNRIHIIEVASAQRVASVAGPPGELHALALNPEGTWMALACGATSAKPGADRGEIVLRKISDLGATVSGDAPGTVHLRCEGGTPTCVAFSPDGQRVAGGLGDGSLMIWETTGKELGTVRAHPAGVFALAFHPDGSRIATGSADGTIGVWDVRTREEKLRLSGHNRNVLAVAFSPDGRLLASGSGYYKLKAGEKKPPVREQGELVLWDAASGQPVRALDADLNAVLSLAFHPDGSSLLWGGSRERLMLLPVSPSLR